jgi:MFS-type transporter involved in bile tolerance (Atg22 family)
MGQANKLAQITKAVLAICLGEYRDYSNITKKFYYSYIAIIRRIRGLIKTQQEANSFYH